MKHKLSRGLGLLGLILALYEAVHEWDYQVNHPYRSGPSGALILLSLAVAVVAAGLVLRD